MGGGKGREGREGGEKKGRMGEMEEKGSRGWRERGRNCQGALVVAQLLQVSQQSGKAKSGQPFLIQER